MQSAYIQITTYIAKAFFFFISTEYPGQGSTNSGVAQVLDKEFLAGEPQ
jgi:hypothetical protein